MRLTPWEEERLLIFGAAELARRHLAAGILLNAPEAVALICDAMLEAARAGRSYADVEAAGLAAVAPDAVIPGVRELVDLVSLEVLLEDGTRLVTLVDPLGRGAAPDTTGPGAIQPGEPREAGEAGEPGDAGASGEPGEHGQSALAGEDLAAAAPARERREIAVTNTSRRAVRVSSHFPFHRANPRLAFDRAAADGFRLDIDAGSSERWAPGETRTVTLVRFGGESGA
jgi:urease subunit gamma/beta